MRDECNKKADDSPQDVKDDHTQIEEDRLERVESYGLVLVVGSDHQKDHARNQAKQIAERARGVDAQSPGLDSRRRRRVACPGIRIGSGTRTAARARHRSSTIWAERARHLRPTIRTKSHVLPPGSKSRGPYESIPNAL